jgi:hypothetical protein
MFGEALARDATGIAAASGQMQKVGEEVSLHAPCNTKAIPNSRSL